jgi:hypothetical protein
MVAERREIETRRLRSAAKAPISPGAQRSIRKFRRFFPGGFSDETYIAWERDYKWVAHTQWTELLGRSTYRRLLQAEEFSEVALRAVRIESRTNLLFSFEKMALRDAIKPKQGARAFAMGLYDFVYGPGGLQGKFERWVEVVAHLPRKQTRVLTWPLVTVFGFIAQPEQHMFLKPNVTRAAAGEYGFDFLYRPRPNWETYSSLLAFAEQVRADTNSLKPRDMIDLQSFIWVQGSDEYDE